MTAGVRPSLPLRISEINERLNAPVKVTVVLMTLNFAGAVIVLAGLVVARAKKS